MSQIKVGHFTGTAADLNLNIGFVPDYFKLVTASGNNDYRRNEWFRSMEVDNVTGFADFLEGHAIRESGVSTDLAVDEGISAYDTAAVLYMIDAPSGANKQIGKTPVIWGPAVDYSSPQKVIRTALLVGDLVLPLTTPNGFVFEFAVAGGVGTTEPTWPIIPGQTVSDANNTYICRTIAHKNVGFQGVSIVAALTEDGIEAFYIAMKSDEDTDHGDAVAFEV